MTVAAWSEYDEGYLRAYQWAGALAAGTPLPQEASPVPLGPGETAHLHLAPVALHGYFGQSAEYRKSFLLLGGPVGLALTGAASLARNATKKSEAERAAIPRWHALGAADLVMTSQRLLLTVKGEAQSLWYAETGPLQPATGAGGAPAVQLQPARMPLLRIESSSAAVLFVMVHHLLEGQVPGVPLPEGLLERARAAGRLGT
jgi:hypothetical protein